MGAGMGPYGYLGMGMEGYGQPEVMGMILGMDRYGQTDQGSSNRFNAS